MKLKVQFISLEEDDKDLIVSFAIEYEPTGVKSLILHRTLFFEELLDEEEKGVRVSMKDDHFEQENINTLVRININTSTIEIKSSFRVYNLDISRIPKRDIENLLRLLRKQNFDNRFSINPV